MQDNFGFGQASGLLLFAADDGMHGAELWASDGLSRTSMIQEIAPGAGSSIPGQFTSVGSMVFFTADDNQNGRELWVISRAALLEALNLPDSGSAQDSSPSPSERTSGLFGEFQRSLSLFEEYPGSSPGAGLP